MGKGARHRKRRATERPRLIVIEDERPTPAAIPHTPTLTTKEPQICQVRGCTGLALEHHDGPQGTVWLCASCGRIARRNLAIEALRERLAEQIAELHKPVLEHYERMRRHIYAR